METPNSAQPNKLASGAHEGLHEGGHEGALINLSRPYEASVHLQRRSFGTANLSELRFLIANETYQLFPYRQAYLWSLDAGEKPKLAVVSGLANLAEDSPFTVWLRKLGAWLPSKIKHEGEYLQVADLPPSARDGWMEWMPEFLLCFPIKDSQGLIRAYAGFAMEDAPDDQLSPIIGSLLDTYGLAWARHEPAVKRKRLAFSLAKIATWTTLALAIVAMFIPVHMSVLAPAEVIGLDAMVVAAPMDGVVKQFAVQPNQLVKANDLLFTLDETTLRNRREIAAKSLAVAKADAMAAQQKSFESDSSKADLAALNGKVAERQAELVYLDDQLKRLEVRANREGVVVFGDINDWQGKPVVTGERIALIADPKDPGVLVYLPVADAINLQLGAPLKLFLQVAPLKPLQAELYQTSYQSLVSAEGVASYRLRAKFNRLDEEQQQLVRIGLKGTAKLYGEKAPLGYYLFRRPLSALREITGW